MMNVYNGNVVLNESGEAIVNMPEYFEALNMNFRYQLTPIGKFAPLYVKKEISNNQFEIAGGEPRMKVSWRVTGVRQDPFANINRVKVEVEKPADEYGYYLHAKAYNMPIYKAISWKKQVESQNTRIRGISFNQKSELKK